MQPTDSNPPASHVTVSQRREKHRKAAGGYIGDLVYGANDGIITTFAVIAGSAGAHFEPSVIIVLGLANLIADGFAMGTGNYLGLRSRQSYELRERTIEEEEIDQWPEEERQEIRDIYRQKGLTGSVLEEVVAIITKDRRQWVDEMLLGELSIFDSKEGPLWLHGAATFAAFVFVGSIPLLPYLMAPATQSSFLLASVGAGFALFAVGSLRTLVTSGSWGRSGLEMLAVGGTAALVAYGIGSVAKIWIG